MNINSYDLIIVGGGPAGSSAARRATNLGLSVLIIEKKKMPREKVCGGALSEQAMSYLDFPIPNNIIDWECYGARVHFNDSVMDNKLVERIAVLVSREKFDQYLWDKAVEAGANVHIANATHFIQKEDDICVFTDDGVFLAKGLIVSQGAFGNMIKQVRKPDLINEYGICIEARVKVKTPDIYKDLVGLIDIYFGLNDHGYGWVFHHKNYYSIGVGGLRDKFKDPLTVFKTFLNERGLKSSDVLIKGHIIPCGGINRKLAKTRVLLAGDSAGFVDAFYGEGLAYAIRSGQLAAETMKVANDKNDYSIKTLQQYEKRCKQEFNSNLKYSLLLARLMHKYPELFLRLLSSDKSVLREYLKVPLNKKSYLAYLIWLLPRIPFYLIRTILKRN